MSMKPRAIWNVLAANQDRKLFQKCSTYFKLIYTTQVNSAFGAQWLASSEMVSQVLFTSKHQAARETQRIDNFSVNCYEYSSF